MNSSTPGTFRPFDPTEYTPKAIAHLTRRPGMSLESFALALTGHRLKGNNATNVKKLIKQLEQQGAIEIRSPSPYQSSHTVHLATSKSAAA